MSSAATAGASEEVKQNHVNSNDATVGGEAVAMPDSGEPKENGKLKDPSKTKSEESNKSDDKSKPGGETENVTIKENEAEGHEATKDAKKEGEAKEEKKREAVGRADQVWNKSKRRFEYFKTAKTKTRKHRFTRYVVFVRRQINEKGFPTVIEVDIKGPRLRQALEDLNKDTKEFGFDDDPPVVDSKIMFHSLDGLKRLEEEAAKQEPQDETLLFELRAGIEFVNHDFESTFSQLETLKPKNQITFHLLWTLFPPNTVVRTDEDRLGHPRAYIVRTSRVQINTDGSINFILNTDYLDSDGKHIGWVTDNSLVIHEFNGVKDVFDLPYYPLNLHPDAEKLKAEHVAAGKIAMERHGRRLVSYRGHGIREGPRASWIKFNSHGRIMLDPESYEQTVPDNGMVPTSIDQIDLKTLDDDKIMLMSTMVYGFSLSDKIWGMFAVAQTAEIVWNDEIFDSLVLESEQKSFVHDLVATHRAKGEAAFDDVVQDKGKGLVGLLAGPPGVGKTLTAEAIAEVTRRPLYMISSGELGESPSIIHEKLTGILELTELWDAVLLLDEADVFLAARDDFSLARNAIISIFLRELEYYQGVIILTTNRITSIDAAFQSRIHFSLKYPDLDLAGRVAIWQYFINKAAKREDMVVKINEGGVRDLAMHEMNGRQIKNAMSVSQAVALKRKQPLTVKAIETAMKLSQHFQRAENEHMYN